MNDLDQLFLIALQAYMYDREHAIDQMLKPFGPIHFLRCVSCNTRVLSGTLRHLLTGFSFSDFEALIEHQRDVLEVRPVECTVGDKIKFTYVRFGSLTVR